MTEQHPLNYYPYEKTMIIPLDKACDDQRDAFQESISEAHKLGLKTGRDEQLEQVMKWLDENLTNYSDADYLGDGRYHRNYCEPLHKLEGDLKKAMRPQEDN